MFIPKVSFSIHNQNIQSTKKTQNFCANSYRDYKSRLDEIIISDKNSKNPVFVDVKPDFTDRISKLLSEKLDNKPFALAITGPNASGKSTLSGLITEIAGEHGDKIAFVSGDNYIGDGTHLVKKYGSYANAISNHIDTEAPETFYIRTLRSNITDLKENKTVYAPKFMLDGTRRSFRDAVRIEPQKFILSEGISTLMGGLDKLFDMKIFIDIDENVRKNRIFERAPKRGYSQDEIQTLWNYWKKAAVNYVYPLKEKCDIVINGEFDFAKVRNALNRLYKVIS